MSTSFEDHLRASWTLLLPSNRARYIAWMTPDEGCFVDGCWNAYAHPHQKFPLTANNGEPWTGGRSLEKVARILTRK